MPNTAKILIICLKHLGDVVTTTPVISLLHDKFTGCEIHYATYPEALPLVTSHPGLAKTFGIPRHLGLSRLWGLYRELAPERYHFALDFSEGARGAKLSLASRATIRVGYRCKGFHLFRNGIPTIPIPSRQDEADRPVTECHADFARAVGCRFEKAPLPKIYPSPKAAAAASEYLESIGVEGPFAVAHLTATDDIRLWPPRHAGKAVAFLSERVGPVLMVSNGSERETSFLKLVSHEAGDRGIGTGALPLDTLMGLLRKARIFIGLDSLGGHMAAALSCPTLSIFGPSREKHWAPRGPMVEIAHTDRACRSCVTGGCLGGGLSACLDELDFDEWVRPKLTAMLAHIGDEGENA
ncbi:MAG: glycosyltransferase family 9 protein [Deltaproteobacteria bacterium]|jgi:ADP-heptose:LPS heptosyltransferase|nr:glycosyltransferase family 9 protein [Deltaproteobacteria bacterium]